MARASVIHPSEIFFIAILLLVICPLTKAPGSGSPGASGWNVRLRSGESMAARRGRRPWQSWRGPRRAVTTAGSSLRGR